jgi:hypothetical protein
MQTGVLLAILSMVGWALWGTYRGIFFPNRRRYKQPHYIHDDELIG